MFYLHDILKVKDLVTRKGLLLQQRKQAYQGMQLGLNYSKLRYKSFNEELKKDIYKF